MKQNNIKKRLPALFSFCLLMILLTASGCVNSKLSSLAKKLSTLDPNALSSPTPTSQLGDSFRIANVIIGAANGTAAPTTTIYFDPSRSVAANPANGPAMMTTHCAGGGTSGANNPKECVCQFSWSESNTTSGNSVPFQRTAETKVTNAQQALVTCLAPSVYATEIANGVSIKITVIAGPINQALFTVNQYSYLKTDTQTTGSFRDAMGRSFDNILHYACYEQFKRGSFIQSGMGTQTNSTTGEVISWPIANKFCVQKPGQAASPGCPNLPNTLLNSAQAYYYNFFVRSGEAGDVNQWNDRFVCPTVKEPIYNGGTVGTQGSLYPMDATFALSLGKSPDFNVGVDAFVELANGGNDPISASAKSCNGQVPGGNSSATGFVQGCLGFAAKPNPDGTCPYFRDSTGLIRFTYRLRRFIAIYPPLFEPNGKAPTNQQSSDAVYVLDRPVTPPNGNDILKPYTMRGPKPCPFSLYDSKGVMGYTDAAYPGGLLPIYGSTNNPAWNGKNVDGIEFPNTDSANSCSAALPIVKSDPFNPDLATISVGTVNSRSPTMKHVYIRPIRAWAPHYEEDLDFQACAPQANPLRDPPLHFAKDPTTGNVSWCAESYPSQNDHVPALDRLNDPAAPLSAANPYIGHVSPYTSHVAKHSASADCIPTIPSTIPTSTGYYPAVNGGAAACTTTASPAGVARHPIDALVDMKNVFADADSDPVTATPVCANKTCDRTAISAGLAWQSFPLLAGPQYTEQAISSDTTFGCTVTYDGGGNKTGKATPTQGCCGPNVKLYTGMTAAPTIPVTPTTHELYNTNAHLEPGTACLTPRY